MMNGGNLEPLMVLIINHLADRLGNMAILKGGMALRLLDCPRFTNDLDYIFSPFSSKKEIKDIVADTLNEIPGITVACSMNSKCLRCIVEQRNQKLQLEINVAKECPTVELSTAALARASNQQGRIVRVMRLDHALSHKLAAWNERGLMRDLFDVYFLFEQVNIKPDLTVFKQRLASSEIRVMRKTAKVRMTIPDFCQKIADFSKTISQEKVESELRDYLAAEQLAGLSFKLKVVIKNLVDYFDKV